MKILISIPRHSSTSAVSDFKLTKADIRDLEASPEQVAQELYLADLVSILKLCSTKYYNTGTSPLSDRAFDALKDELMARKPNHPFLKQVGAPVTKVTTSGSRKVKLPYPLFSLDKVKGDNGSLEKWLSRNKGPYVVSDKEDGNSLEIVYDQGSIGVYSRGDGIWGQDLSHLVPHLRIPRKVPYKKLVVRAETIIAISTFNKQFGEKYKNARNLVAGAVNKRTIHEAIPYASVIAYEIIEPRIKPSEALGLLKSWGFEVVPHKVYRTIDGVMLSKLLTYRRQKSKYEIDGLVIEQDSINKRPSPGDNPSYAVAFKENYSTTTTVLGVDWEESQYGVLKPVVRVKPLVLDGVTVKNVTGHNAWFIENGFRSGERNKLVKPIGKGAVVEITRSGGVIPHIVQVLSGARAPDLPKVPYTYNKSGIDIVLETDSNLVRDKQIASFFSTLGVDFIKLGIVQKITSSGLNTVPKILRASVEDFKRIPGFQERLAQKLWTSIKEKTREVPLDLLMSASGVFGFGLGARKFKPIVDKYPDLLDWNKSTQQIIDLVSDLQGFQETTARKFALGLPKFQKWLRIVSIKPILPTRINPTGSKLKGQVVVFTGVRNQDLEKTIILQGGALGTTVNAKTTILIVKDPSSTSSKATRARSLGIPIMTIASFRTKFRI